MSSVKKLCLPLCKIGAFRIGTIDNIHLSVAHKGGKTDSW